MNSFITGLSRLVTSYIVLGTLLLIAINYGWIDFGTDQLCGERCSKSIWVIWGFAIAPVLFVAWCFKLLSWQRTGQQNIFWALLQTTAEVDELKALLTPEQLKDWKENEDDMKQKCFDSFMNTELARRGNPDGWQSFREIAKVMRGEKA